jgi:hypothetical protein
MRGHRYSIVYRPGATNRTYPSTAADLAKRILQECRGVPFERAWLRQSLTDGIDRALDKYLDGQVGEWLSFIWNAEHRVLLPAFGRFRSQSWASRFAAGNGVAGHAFRHSQAVAWKRTAGAIQTIYQEITDPSSSVGTPYEWILCVPLRLERDGPSIGVLGFARTESKTKVDRALENLVNLNLRKQALLGDLETVVNVAFWGELARSQELEPDHKRYATERIKAVADIEFPPHQDSSSRRPLRSD